jgi:hypothetical protein
MIKYKDRLLYATDMVAREKSDPGSLKKALHDTWISDWKFFTSKDEMSSPEFVGSFQGLQLPKEVVDCIYYKNAQRWLGL